MIDSAGSEPAPCVKKTAEDGASPAVRLWTFLYQVTIDLQWMKMHYDKNRGVRTFKVNDRVWLTVRGGRDRSWFWRS